EAGWPAAGGLHGKGRRKADADRAETREEVTELAACALAERAAKLQAALSHHVQGEAEQDGGSQNSAGGGAGVPVQDVSLAIQRIGQLAQRLGQARQAD